MFTAISSLFVRPEDQGRCEFAEREAGNYILHASIHFDIIPASGEKMTYAEFENLILLSDRMISSCVPRKSEYWRGYNSGIKFHFQNGRQESLPDHYFIIEIARRDGSRDVHAYARGYRDGCNGLIPEEIP